MCFDFKWVQDLKSVCNSDQTIFSCKSFWVKSWWQPMKLGIRWWSSESSNEKNVGTRFYLVIVRKHTKVKHFAFVASLSVFSYVWLCKFDQTITMLDDDNGWLPLFRNKIFLRKKEVMFTFCYCIPNNSSLLSRWKCPFVSLFKQKKKCLPSHLHQKSTYHYYPSFYSDHGCYFFHCFMVNIQANSILGWTIFLRVWLCRDEFKGGGFITFWVLENTKFHTFKKYIRKYLPCNVITSIDGWAAMLCFLCCILIKPIDQS